MGLGSHTCAQSLGDFESKLKIKNTERSNVLVITRNVVTEIMMMIMRRCHSGILCDSEVHSGEIWVDFFSGKMTLPQYLICGALRYGS